MAILSLAERRSILDEPGETFTFPGGVQRTGRWEAPTTDEIGVRGSEPAGTFVFEDVDEFRIADMILRDGNGTRYVIRDIEPDGVEGFTRLDLEEQP